jgi:S-adenosylmethionine-diacylgycerolhomoserine-N-methlytransferase
MGLVSELRTLRHLLFTRVQGGSHADRLESFYRGQAKGYDDFRRKLLHGRKEMMARLELREGGRLLDMGGGTGSNLEFLGERLHRLDRVEIVDLCPSLLEAARERIARKGWDNVSAVQGDATYYEPARGLVDAISFSYSLTMMPDWFAALERAYALLPPGGMVGVVDFYVSRKWPADGMRRHRGFTRWFWPAWFGFDNVFPSPDHLPWLRSRFETIYLKESSGRVPYLLGMKAPYYIYVGRKR